MGGGCFATGMRPVGPSSVYKPSYPLTVFGDTSQCILLLGALFSVVPIAFHADGRTRLFGWLMSLGFILWFSAQLLWTYFEVYRRQQVPNPFLGDIILFLHIVPMMAALAVRLISIRQTARLAPADSISHYCSFGGCICFSLLSFPGSMSPPTSRSTALILISRISQSTLSF